MQSFKTKPTLNDLPTTNQTIVKSREAKSLEGVGVLVGLGLSERQARVYLGLLKAGGGRAKIVSELTAISRQDIYRLFAELLELGLVRQNLTTPSSYMAVPFTETVTMLFEEKTKTLTLISQKAKRVTEKYRQNPPALTATDLPTPCFGTVMEGVRGKKYLAAITDAKECIEAVSSWGRFRQMCFRFDSELKAALKRGVHVRMVVEKPPKQYFPKWVSVLNNPAFELKTTPNPPAAVITIFDDTKVAVAFDATTRLTKGPDLWSTHPGLVAAGHGYFEGLWATLE
jgi:sugar-specific transcriptional regulator TrmB